MATILQTQTMGEKIMNYKLNNDYKLISPKKDIDEFISSNINTMDILEEIKPNLTKCFPNSDISLELCDDIQWTTERKLS